MLVAIASACGGGGGDKEPTATRGPSDSGGLTTREPATPEATIALGGNGGTVERPGAIPGENPNDRLRISAAGVDAVITPRVVPASGGELASPIGADDVVFYDFSAFDGLGGFPGVGGRSILSGHVDYGRGPCKNGTVPPPCQAVFWDVHLLKPGDMIELAFNGSTLRYRVTGSQDVSATDYETWDKLWQSTPEETLALITCGGDFNRTTREYSHRHVVMAVRV